MVFFPLLCQVSFMVAVFSSNWKGKSICVYVNRDMASVKSQENEQTAKTDADPASFIL